MKHPALAVTATSLAVAMALSACGGGGGSSAIQKAYDTCAARAKPQPGKTDQIHLTKVMTVEDDGHTLVVAPEQGVDESVESLRTYFAVVCALGELKAPDSLTSQLQTTTGLMGRQTTTWGKYKIVYSYSGNSGLDATITDGGT